MTNIITLASRRAAPIPTTTGTHAHQQADLVHLHMAACNALRTALHHLTGPDTSPCGWALATARATRGLSALKQASALVNQAGG